MNYLQRKNTCKTLKISHANKDQIKDSNSKGMHVGDVILKYTEAAGRKSGCMEWN